MGFEVDITRYYLGDDPIPIPLDEWLALARSQDDWTITDNNQFIYGDGVYFSYIREGTISVNPSDQSTMRRITELAHMLNVMVIDDQGLHRFMPDGRILFPDPDDDHNHIDEGYRWDNDEYWQEPDLPPDSWWTPIENWWFRLKVAWRTRNIQP